MDIRELIGGRVLLFDGAMGTMLQQRGLPPGELPELYSLTHPDTVRDIHRDYVSAGADIITTNTFQAHELKLGGKDRVREVAAAAVGLARESGAQFVALDIGPTGQLLEPMGTMSFERAYEIFREPMIAGEKAGADLVIIETFSDIYEAKAAILAAKENTALPVVCSITFQGDGRTFAGCDPLTAALILQGLGADALGVNCSLGPESLMPVVDIMLKYSHVPVIVQANAGLPQIRGGLTVYDLSAEVYAEQVMEMVRRGIRLVGGCCGTTPRHIALLREKLGEAKPYPVSPVRVSACTSGTRTVILDGRITEIGERLNPTGKKAMQQALRAGDLGFMAGEAIEQVRLGASVLDLNAGLPDIDEPAVLKRLVREIQAVTDAPLQIDSSDPTAIEAAVRVYNGIPIINSVNGKKEPLDSILPLAKKYGALLVGLTLDENGIPPTAQGRYEIAARIQNAAAACGIPKENLIIDCLVLTASAQQAQVKETLSAIALVKSGLGLKTVLGISNVSFGLPEREKLNAAFLANALGAGLDAAIINPYSQRCREVLDACRVFSGEDKDAAGYISRNTGGAPTSAAPEKASLPLSELIGLGLKDKAASTVEKLLENTPPLEIIDNEFIPALDRVGKRFETGELFLPQLMLSAQAVQSGFAVISRHMRELGQERQTKGKILLATVSGDIHDIGKNIVKMLLDNYGYEVIDLGKDVAAETVVEAIRRHSIRLAGLSALMTTTVKSMKETISAARAEGLDCTFFVGGAVLNPEYAAFVGADYYAKDAMEGVTIANRFFGEGI